MGSNTFDDEFERLEGGGAHQQAAKVRGADRLLRLKGELETSSKADEGVLRCVMEDETLLISVRGQPIGVWRHEAHTLTLYRAGSEQPDCQATSVAEAAKLSARLVAAVAQA